jgi:hypothetical protein
LSCSVALLQKNAEQQIVGRGDRLVQAHDFKRRIEHDNSGWKNVRSLRFHSNDGLTLFKPHAEQALERALQIRARHRVRG